MVAEYLMDKWLLQVLCEDSNKYSLVPNIAIDDTIHQNLIVVRAALNSLFISDESFKDSELTLPAQVVNVCRARRPQAMRFLKEFLLKTVPEKTI